jgi:dTMP kinase
MAAQFIVIEGINGAGKSTLAKYLKNTLTQNGYRVQTPITREQDKEELFQSVINNFELDIDSRGYMFLHLMLYSHKADRVRHALESDQVVIADRWDLSFLSYHGTFGFFSRRSEKLREEICRLAFDELQPSLKLFLDVSIDTAITRRIGRGDQINDLPAERRHYAELREAYRLLAARNGWTTIDANDEIYKVNEMAWKLISQVA